MDSKALQFYDQLSDKYDILYEDWPAIVRQQSEVLDRLVRSLLGDGPPRRMLDCACGIGTQAIGLALRGHQVHATDLSPKAVARAQREAQGLGASLTFGVADVRDLTGLPGDFDVILACNNALPHLLSDEDLLLGVRSMAARLRPGGLFLASIRDYDTLAPQKPTTTPVRVHSSPPFRRVIFQFWDWAADGRTYTFHHFFLADRPEGWRLIHNTARYRALLRADFESALAAAGLMDVCWHDPSADGFHQPIVTARRP
jgi:SAM-dependent methyltransferase